jgi:hypothetical protein
MDPVMQPRHHTFNFMHTLLLLVAAISLLGISSASASAQANTASEFLGIRNDGKLSLNGTTPKDEDCSVEIARSTAGITFTVKAPPAPSISLQLGPSQAVAIRGNEMQASLLENSFLTSGFSTVITVRKNERNEVEFVHFWKMRSIGFNVMIIADIDCRIRN